MRLIKDPNSHTFEYLQKRLLKVVENLQDWLVENPASLMWLMCHWENVFYAGRIGYGYEGIIKKGRSCEDNPRYEIEGLDYNSTKNENLIYTAFANARENIAAVLEGVDEVEFGSYSKAKFDTIRESYKNRDNDRYVFLSNKTNKTLDEWVELLSNKRHRYHSIYGSRERVLSSLLANRSGYDWNEDGYVTSDSSDKFTGWQEVDISSFPNAYQAVIEQIIYCDLVQNTTPVVKKYFEDYKAKKKQEEIDRFSPIMSALKVGESATNGMDLDSIMDLLHERLGEPTKKKHRYQFVIDKDARMMTLPDNVHESYVVGSYEIVKYILDNPNDFDKHDIKLAKAWYQQKPARKYKIDQFFNG